MNKPSIIIRLATDQDARAIAAIHVASWQKIYRGYIPDTLLNNLSVSERELQWRNLIHQKIKILVLEKENVLLGFASFGPSRDADTDSNICGEISAIYLNPAIWHQGVGTQLCNKVLSELENMGCRYAILWVLKENNLARKFYESIGFTMTGDSKEDIYDKKVILNEVRFCQP
ncbi:MAG: hypothetical protein ACD_60C00041G0006 [uncultured bacterium]|nr:MAG: hypothetical protein ACD_60C00041G0006 [uncultured bacterium]